MVSHLIHCMADNKRERPKQHTATGRGDRNMHHIIYTARLAIDNDVMIL